MISSLFGLTAGWKVVKLLPMYSLPGKFVALLLAVWLPLISGNALAASIVMPSMGGDCQAMQTMQTASAMNQHLQLASDQQQQIPPQDQHNTCHNDHGICQLTCCSYLAAVTLAIADIPSAAQSFAPSSTQFQSFTSAPLDPPPLARA
jgi:hypothetical protein